MAVLPFLVLVSVAVASVTPDSCGVSKPLFKDSSIKVEPIDTHNWLQIGFSAVIGWVGHMGFPFMPPGEHAPKQHDGLRCLMPYLMNCTHWQELSAGNPCPEECPFIAQVKPFACAFTCVNVTQCHYTDPNMPFANPSSQLCEESSIEGCGVQAQAGQCERCRKHFAMDRDGTRCLYDREGSIIWLVEHLHAMGYWVWVILVMMLSCCCWQFRSALSKHWHLLTFARMHYHLCKVRKNPKVHAGAPLFSICENLHTKFVIGIGLPLYYNSLVFLLILTVLLFFSTHLALDSDSQSLFNYSGVSSNMVQVLNVPIYPSAEGVSDASICSWAMEDKDQTRFNVDTTSKSFMHRLSRTALFLWFASLAIMFVHAWFQLKHARWFESQHLTMKDFALVLSGLPPHVTDERMLAECISRQIGEDIRAVSIGYDVTSCWNEVETLLDRHLAYCDAHFCGHPDVGLRPWPQGSRDSEMLGPLALQRNMEQDRKWVQDWFRPGSSREIQGSGFAWAVFSSHRDRDEALHKMLALEKDRRGIHWRDADGTCHPLDFGIPRCEPTNVRWDHLGLGLCSRRCRFLGALFIWFLAAAALALLIYVPYAEYVTGFLNEAGKFPQGFMMGLLGFLIGLTWWAMCMMIGTCVNIAGFQTIEDENLFIFIFFTIFCVAASAFNVYLTWYYTQDLWQHHTSSWFESVEGSLLKTGGPVTTLRDLRKEIDLGFRVFQVLVPGVLFTPCLLSPLNNFLIPYFRESALLVLFGQGKSGREAERFLEPLPIGLAWDYQGHVTLPCCCCLTLFIMSPSMWWAQAYLCIWAFFFYLFQRFMHLRVCKKMYCTSNKLDSMVLYFGWGLLLAELAACHAYWRVRLQEWEWISILQSVIMSYAIYWTLLWALGVPWPLRLRGELDVLERSRERSDDDRCQSCEDFCYNWLNVNPVYVLKSQYCDSAMEPVIFYEPGKEYLQLAPTDETCVQNTSNQRWKMATSGLWLELEGLGCIGITPFLDSEVCGSDMVMSPADRLQEEGLLARQHGLDGQSDGPSGMDGSGSLPFAAETEAEQSEQVAVEDDKAVEQKEAHEPVILRADPAEDTRLLPEQEPADVADVDEEKLLPGPSPQAEEPEKNADVEDEDKAEKAVENEKAGDLPKKALLPVPSPEVSLEQEVSSRSMYSLLAQSSNATPHEPEEEVRWSAIATEESSELPGCSPEAKDSPPADTATDTATGTPAPDVPDASDALEAPAPADPMPEVSEEEKSGSCHGD